MRSWFWLVGGVAGIAGSIGAGCSSSSSPSDAGFGGGDATENEASTGPADAGCILYDANLSFVKPSDAAGADCAVCLVDKCQTPINQCQADCLCDNYFACVAYLAGDAGVQAWTICAGSKAADLASNAAISALYVCETTTCKDTCVPATDAATAGGG